MAALLIPTLGCDIEMSEAGIGTWQDCRQVSIVPVSATQW